MVARVQIADPSYLLIPEPASFLHVSLVNEANPEANVILASLGMFWLVIFVTFFESSTILKRSSPWWDISDELRKAARESTTVETFEDSSY